MSVELGTAIHCIDVSAKMLRWDLEARDVINGEVMRRIGHTRTVSQRIAKAMAEVGKEFWRALEVELARLGECGHWV